MFFLWFSMFVLFGWQLSSIQSELKEIKSLLANDAERMVRGRGNADPG